MMIYKITNICFKGQTNCPININQLYDFKNKIKMKFEPKNFPGLIIHLSLGTCLIFKSGYYSICGCKRIEDGSFTQLELFEILNRNNYKIKNNDLILTNICGCFDFEKPINLIKLALRYKEQSYYDVEYFPGLKFTLNNHVFTIHHTGKVFVTGMKSVRELENYFNVIIQILTEII